MKAKKPEPKQPRVRLPWQRDRELTPGGGESTTDQSAAAETDVNAIVARFKRTGELPPAQKQGIYTDVTHLQGDLTERLLWAQEQLQNVTTAIELDQLNQQKEADKLNKEAEEKALKENAEIIPPVEKTE